MAHIPYIDGLIKEYLLFRGFSSTLKAFESEMKSDRFCVAKIMDKINHYISTQDLASLRELWTHLSNTIFNKLEQVYVNAVKRLETSLFKFYLVAAYLNNKPEKINEFFSRLAPELQHQSEWKEWFMFPFCKNPEEHPVFTVFFSKQWQDTLMISLHNFLATAFQCMPLPTLARIESEASLIKKLQEENAVLRDRLEFQQSSSSGSTTSRTLDQHTSPTSSSSASSHQSRLSTFNDQPGDRIRPASQFRHSQHVNSLDDIIVPYPIAAPKHIVDDFYIIAQEITMGQATDSQLRGFKSLIRNIGGSGSPTMVRKDASGDRNKKRSSSSAGPRTWNTRD